MKNLIHVTILLALITLGALLTGCGSSNSSSTVCASGYTLYNGTCYSTSSITSSSSYSGTCYSISSSIPFYGSGLASDYYGELYGGTIPNTSSYGTITVGSTTTVSGTTYTGYNTASYSPGTLSMTVTGISSSYYSYSTSTSLSGTLAISSYYQSLIQSFATSQGYGTACVSGLAVAGRLYSGYFLGYVFVYLNGTSHGYTLTFD